MSQIFYFICHAELTGTGLAEELSSRGREQALQFADLYGSEIKEVLTDDSYACRQTATLINKGRRSYSSYALLPSNSWLRELIQKNNRGSLRESQEISEDVRKDLEAYGARASTSIRMYVDSGPMLVVGYKIFLQQILYEIGAGNEEFRTACLDVILTQCTGFRIEFDDAMKVVSYRRVKWTDDKE